MLVYRIVSNQYANSLYASGLPGRWNLRGEPIIYTAASAEIALLENMAHRMGQGGFMRDGFACLEIEVPNTSIQVVKRLNLPQDWGSASPYRQTQSLGSAWYKANKHLLLRVPSAPASTGSNYLINATHTLFQKVGLSKSYPYPIDHRLAKLDKDLT